MLSFNDAVNILNKMPPELVSIIFNYLDGIDMVNFINDNKDAYINELNITKDELNVWNSMNYSENKLFEWCKILFRANVNCWYYKMQFDNRQIKSYYNSPFSLPTNKEKKYNRKLYIGLFLNAGLNIERSYYYSNLSVNKITIIFKIMKDMPDQFTIPTLFVAINFNKELEPNENYINYAIKIKQIRSSCKENYINPEHLKKTVVNFPDAAYERLISLLDYNLSFETALILSTPSRKFTDALIDKFKELKEELQIKDDLLIRNLRNNKIINNIRILKNKNISLNCIEHLINDINKLLLEDLIKNNYIYEFDYHTWNKINHIYNNNNEIYPDIFIKFTLKQQNNLRMKQLMEDEGYNDLLEKCINENINFMYGIIYTTNNTILVEQYFYAYTELSERQFKYFMAKMSNGANYEETLANSYQIIDYYK
jgi:hypothetical protein